MALHAVWRWKEAHPGQQLCETLYDVNPGSMFELMLGEWTERIEKGECHLRLADLLEYAEGQLLILALPHRFDAAAAQKLLEQLRDSRADGVWLAASLLYRGDDKRRLARLHRLAHRVVWANPHKGAAGYQPVQSGIAAALPHVDDFVSGHSMAAFAEVLEGVARA